MSAPMSWESIFEDAAYEMDGYKIVAIKDEQLHRLYQEVKCGRLSWVGAAIQAGMREPEVKVPVDDMRALTRKLSKVLTSEQVDELIAELTVYRG